MERNHEGGDSKPNLGILRHEAYVELSRAESRQETVPRISRRRQGRATRDSCSAVYCRRGPHLGHTIVTYKEMHR